MSNQGAASALSTTNVPITELARGAIALINRAQSTGAEAEGIAGTKSFLAALAEGHLVCIGPAELKELRERAEGAGAAKPDAPAKRSGK
jgi:hypothetical protein